MAKAQILIVEDDPMMAETIQSSIESMGYCVAGVVSTGTAAVASVSDGRVDLVLMDVLLKGEMNGIEAAERIRAKYEIPVVYLTAFPGKELLGRAKFTELYGYVLKPYNYSELHYTIEVALHRYMIEKKLKMSENKYRTLFEEGIDGIGVSDVNNGIMVDCNKAFCRLVGREKQDIIGKSQRLFHLDDGVNRYAVDLLHAGRKGAKDPVVKDSIITKTGELREVEISASAIEIDGSQYLFRIFRDVTERNRLEAQLRHAQKMESIGTLAGGIAHDFNNILFRMYGYLEMAQEEAAGNPLLAEYIQAVLDEAILARDLVKQILSFSRRADQEFKPVDISLIVKETAKMLKSSIPSSIEIRHHVKTEGGKVLADAAQVHQIIMNLVSNAYQEMEETGGTLTIGLKEMVLSNLEGIEPGRYVCLTVKDTGKGISPIHMDRIFDPYFTTKDKNKGTGLGLAMVNSIVKNHYGHITVNSKPGMGTEFHVYLPVTQQESEPEIGDEALLSFKNGKEHILLVDDEEGIIQMGQRMLESKGYRLTVMTSSREALRLFQMNPHQFDLVLTDLTMPDLMGDKLAAEMIRIRPDLPIIMFTGFAEKMTMEKAVAIGIKSLLIKPVRKNILLNEIRSILDQKQGLATGAVKA